MEQVIYLCLGLLVAWVGMLVVDKINGEKDE